VQPPLVDSTHVMLDVSISSAAILNFSVLMAAGAGVHNNAPASSAAAAGWRIMVSPFYGFATVLLSAHRSGTNQFFD
jgi:hypothetical protein